MVCLGSKRAPLKISALVAGSVAAAVLGGFWTLPALTFETEARAQEQMVLPPKPDVTWIQSPNFDDRPAGAVIDTLVIHDTETPGIRQARTIASHFVNPRSGVSAHFIIGKAGEIVQCVDEEKRAFHAGPSLFRGRDRVNDFSIGIELVNSQSGSDPFTDQQYRSLARLTRYLLARFAIPADRITGHHDVTLRPHVKRDPAPNFDWDRYLLAVDTRQPSPGSPNRAAAAKTAPSGVEQVAGARYPQKPSIR